jgi:hypothetical protein
MKDSGVHDVMEALGALRASGTEYPAGSEEIAADVARGHRAMNRRRRFRVAGVGLTAAVAAAGLSLAVAGPFGASGSNVAGQQTPPPSASAPSSASANVVQLAAYTGNQPVGFKVDTVPEGWKVTSMSREAFVAVPPGTPNRHEQKGVVSFEGAIAVMMQGSSRFPADASLTKVKVRGEDGQLGLTDDKTAKWLIFPDAAGRKVLVQVPVELGLSDDQIVQFAQGVTVTDEARASVG